MNSPPLQKDKATFPDSECVRLLSWNPSAVHWPAHPLSVPGEYVSLSCFSYHSVLELFQGKHVALASSQIILNFRRAHSYPACFIGYFSHHHVFLKENVHFSQKVEVKRPPETSFSSRISSVSLQTLNVSHHCQELSKNCLRNAIPLSKIWIIYFFAQLKKISWLCYRTNSTRIWHIR